MNTNREKILWNYLQARLPRIITQLSRDPDSPTFGSWDRNFWHYKMRDFSSMILQQGMMVIDAMKDYNTQDNPFYQHPLAENWIEASLGFWARNQLRNGSFNEYYPYESGFPPTAFSLFATGVIFKNRNYSSPDAKTLRAAQKAINWLLAHPEKEALNQEAAGLSGIVLCSALPGITVDKEALDKRLSQFYDSQTSEGWFPEYDGPDTGYLAVTIDCLWEIYESTGDPRAFNAMERAIGFIGSMLSVSSETPIMINSRNTDYLVIYGMTRMALKGNQAAAAIINRIIDRLDHPGHFLNRTDDRYSVHYVYASYFRSIPYIKQIPVDQIYLPSTADYRQYFPEAGILVTHKNGGASIYVNLKKGGVVNVFDRHGIKSADFGFRVKIEEKKVAVTHFQHPRYVIENENDAYIVSGRMTVHGWMVPSPLKHIVLRAVSFTFGNRLIPLLKKAMIFNKKESGYMFQRKVAVMQEKIIIEDVFSGNNIERAKIYRAPHYSLRHVSSAGQFMTEELLTIPEDKGTLANGRAFFNRHIEY